MSNTIYIERTVTAGSSCICDSITLIIAGKRSTQRNNKSTWNMLHNLETKNGFQIIMRDVVISGTDTTRIFECDWKETPAHNCRLEQFKRADVAYYEGCEKETARDNAKI